MLQIYTKLTLNRYLCGEKIFHLRVLNMTKSLLNFLRFNCLTLLLLLLSNNSFAHQVSVPIQNNMLQTSISTNDTLLVLNIEMQYGARVLLVSFNGNEGTDGTLQIKQNTTVVKTASFELIKQPFYASVDISNLTVGTYQVILTTATGTHTSSILID